MRVGRAGPRSWWTHRLLQYVIAAASAQDEGHAHTLAALKIRTKRLDHGTHKELARAMVKVAMAEEHARERERGPRPFRSAHARGGEKDFP